MSKLLAMMMNKKYTRMEYIESTGTQYIDTNIVPKTTYKYKIKYAVTELANIVLFGSRTSGTYNTSRNQVYFTSYNDESVFLRNYYVNNNTNNDFRLNIIPSIDTIIQTPLIQNENCIIENATQPIYLFALNILGTASSTTKARIYNMQIYDNDTLIFNAVPVIRNSDNEIGMLDRVSGQFFGNVGTGKFRFPNEVGYKVVGTPTIVDGVVSGFSASNYLQSSSIFQGSLATSFEFSTKFNISSFSSTSTIVSSINSTIPFHFSIRDRKFRLYPGREDTYKIGSFVLSENVDYYIKLLWDSSNGWKLQYSTDGINYITDFENYNPSNSYPKDNYIVIGRNYVNGGQEALQGSIDLNSTYIKVNNKLWFNGQPAS